MSTARPALPFETEAAAFGPTLGRTLAAAIAGGLLIAALEFASTRASVSLSWADQALWLARLCGHWSLAALPLGLAIGVMEHRTRGHASSLREYAVAVAAGASAGALLLAAHAMFVDLTISRTAVGFDMEFPDRFLHGLWLLSFWGGAGAVLHATNVRQRRSAAAFRAGELARLGRQQRVAKASLEALHAQIEPEFLLSTLSAIERLYEEDRAAADEVLDALIRFLRQATPLLRRQSWTIGEEARLLDAYMRAVWAGAGRAPGLVEVEPAIEKTAIPSGVLLSTAQHLLGALPFDSGELSIKVGRGPQDGRTRIDLSVTADDRWETSQRLAFVAASEQRFKRSCGAGTTLEVVLDELHRWQLHITLAGNGEMTHEQAQAE